MNGFGGRWIPVAAALGVALAACSASGSDGARPDVESSASTTTSESEEGVGEPTTTVPAAPVPWSQLAVAGSARTGRLTRLVDTVQNDSNQRIGELYVVESLKFDRDRTLLEGAVTVSDEAGETSHVTFVYAEAGMFMSADWVQEQCGTEWVAIDPAMAAEAGLEAVDVDDLSQLGPFGALEEVDPPAPTESTLVGSTYDVELSAAMGIAPSYVEEHPGLEAELGRRTSPAQVTIEHDLDARIEQWLPFPLLAEAGGDDAGPAGDELSIHSVWVLEHVGDPIDIEVPTDVAEDPSCADG